jgi:chromosome segregation ATPase
MTDELTQKLTPFESTVLQRFDQIAAKFDQIDARFDQIDARFDQIEARLDALEAKTYDTRPIWERALAEILEVKTKVTNLERSMRVLNDDVLQVRTDLRGFDERIRALEKG